MSSGQNQNSRSNSNTNSEPYAGINPQTINTLISAAGTGMKMFDSFLTQITPHVNDVLSTASGLAGNGNSNTNMGNRNTTAGNCNTTAGNSNTTAGNGNSNTTTNKQIKELNLYRNESDSLVLLALEIPRISKDNCSIKLNGNILEISAKTHSSESNFEFLDDIEYKNMIKIDNIITKEHIKARFLNGMLYIEVNKNIKHDNKIDINIENY